MNLEDTIPFTDISYFDLILFIVALVVGWIVTRAVVSMIKRSMGKTNLPPLMVDFMGRLIGILLLVAVILFAVGFLGVNTGSLVLGLSAVLGLVIAFGMQDTVNNFFAGVWIAMIRPFEKGEAISVQGLTGTVRSVGIMSTEMVSFQNEFITIPNRSVWGQAIVNYSRMPVRRADVSVGISYGDDVEKAFRVALDVMRNHEMVLDDPAPAVMVTELGDSSVNLSLRPWADNPNWWTVKVDITKQVHEAFRKEGIEIPFPQMDVHLDKTA
ncbi:MAG: mechanosensitive ion channel family protein [Methanomassiliicoccales archaeon]